MTDMITNVQVRKLRVLGIEDLIKSMVTSEEVGSEKPHPIISIPEDENFDRALFTK